MSLRRLIVEADPSTFNVTAFCEAHAVSTWFFYELRRRYVLEGEAALEPRSRAPKRVTIRVPDAVRDEIVRIRKDLGDRGFDNGPASISVELHRLHGWAPSEATIWRVLRERGFITPQPRKAPKRSRRRFVAERANECWQLDATGWMLADGTPVEIINVLDDCSRALIVSVAVPICTTATTWDALCQGASRWGWPERVLSDNAAAFKGRPNLGGGGITPNLAVLGIRHAHSRPYHPQTCGKVERLHQTQKKYLVAQPLAVDLAELQHQLNAFADYYNHHRPHRALNRRTPAEVWATTPKSGPADQPLTIPTRIHHATVDAHGQITIAGPITISLGAAHHGQPTTTVITGTHAHVFIDGKLTRSLTIDPTRRHQPLHPRPGHPTTTSNVPRHP